MWSCIWLGYVGPSLARPLSYSSSDKDATKLNVCLSLFFFFYLDDRCTAAVDFAPPRSFIVKGFYYLRHFPSASCPNKYPFTSLAKVRERCPLAAHLPSQIIDVFFYFYFFLPELMRMISRPGKLAATLPHDPRLSLSLPPTPSLLAFC